MDYYGFKMYYWPQTVDYEIMRAFVVVFMVVWIENMDPASASFVVPSRAVDLGLGSEIQL